MSPPGWITGQVFVGGGSKQEVEKVLQFLKGKILNGVLTPFITGRGPSC